MLLLLLLLLLVLMLITAANYFYCCSLYLPFLFLSIFLSLSKLLLLLISYF